MLRAEAGLGALPRRALAQYLRLLRLYPVLTKAATRSARSGWDRAGGGGRPGARTARDLVATQTPAAWGLSVKGPIPVYTNDPPKI